MSDAPVPYEVTVCMSDGSRLVRRYGTDFEALTAMNSVFNIITARKLGHMTFDGTSGGRRTRTVLNPDHIVSISAAPADTEGGDGS